MGLLDRNSLLVGICIAVGASTVFTFSHLENTESTIEEFLRNPSVETTTQQSTDPTDVGVKRYSNYKSWNRLSEDGKREDFYNGIIIFSSTIAYSERFARAYGYPEKHVTSELPEFVDFIEYEMKYAGEFQQCQLKLLIDKDGPVKLAPEPMFFVFNGGNLEMFRAALPRKISTHAEKQYQREFRLNKSAYAKYGNYVLNNYHLIGRGLQGTPNAFSSISLVMTISKPDLFSEWTYVALGIGCTELTRNIMRHNKVSLAMPPSETKKTSTTRIKNVGEVVEFVLPSTFRQQALTTLNKIDFDKQ
jgi:hypothetical protein